MKYRLCLLVFAFSFSLRAANPVWLSSVVDTRNADDDGGLPALNSNQRRGPLRIAGHDYASGVGTRVDTRIALELNGATRFTAFAGVDDASPGAATILFEVIADGRSLWRAELKKGGDPIAVDLDVGDRKTLVLVTDDLGNTDSKSLADWADAKVIAGESPPKAVFPPAIPEPAVVLTPLPPRGPRINGARVFGVRPGHPFLFQVPATGDRPMAFSADGLPDGLVIDPSTGLITGVIASPGVYRVTLRASNARGADSKPLRIEAGESIALTPPMGWNSWNCWAGAVDQEKVLASAQAMHDSGLIQHGWSYVNIDDTWQGARTGADHALQPNRKFPDMGKLCREIHALGLKAGIYSTPFIISYAGYAGGTSDNPDGARAKPPKGKRPYGGHGRYSFAGADARQWAQWGMDYLKYDWNPIRAPETAEMARALRDSGRDIVFSLSNSAPFAGAADWARLANSWRTTGDIRDTWSRVCDIGFSQDKWRPFAGPGHWNDPDMLVVGNVGWGPRLHASQLTPNEQYTHISLWCLLSAPLLIGCPIEQMDAFTQGLLTNDEVLAIDQDELGRQAAQLVVDGRRQIWVKQLADGSRAIGLFNLAQAAQDVSISWAQLGLSGPVRVRDSWRQQDLGTMADGFTARVQRHGVVLVRVWPAAK